MSEVAFRMEGYMSDRSGMGEGLEGWSWMIESVVNDYN